MNRKLRMGMVGGGKDAFIGAIHRHAAGIDGLIELVCGALSINPDIAKDSGKSLFLPESRTYLTFEEMITKEIGELDKKTVKLRGFILPTSVFQNSGIKQFVLVRDNQECCFGPGALLFDCVIIEMEPGKTATFSTRVVSVKGKLEIDSESFRYPEGGHYAIYKMTAEEVK